MYKKVSFFQNEKIYFKQTAEIQIVCVEWTTNSDIVCCYRLPNALLKWLLAFNEFLHQDANKNTNKKIIVTGEFNFPHITWSENVVLPSKSYNIVNPYETSNNLCNLHLNKACRSCSLTFQMFTTLWNASTICLQDNCQSNWRVRRCFSAVFISLR